MNLSRKELLICSICPYFLEKGNFWFEKNLKKLLEAKKTQSFFEDNLIFCRINENYNLSQFLRKLDELGYEKVYKVTFLGEFAHRGGIVDVFPINLNKAVRIEFFGNKISNIFELPIKIDNEKEAKEILKKKLKSQKLFSELKNLKPGDYLVHLDHGIGIYKGKINIRNTYYYELEYDQGDKLYVPFNLKRKLSRYIGFVAPKISKLGTPLWQKTKRKIKKEAEKLAKELLEIAAAREITIRTPYLPSKEIDSQIASTFPYQETPDQLQTIEDINKDLESNRPMNRIVCGDVGFGKTEIALRAAVKAVYSGYQVAFLCPTTILASQHFQNFKERLKNLPIKVALLSRLQTKKEQKNTIEEIKKGKVDIVIGTHRILSSDVEFKNLDLLIIDDEHKFGVKQKEKFKKARTGLNVLSLSATPIPRTLYLALSSLQDISLIQTPPENRKPVKTFIFPWSKKIIKKAIFNELSRKGQVYYLHNRIETIESVKNFLESLSPSHKKWKIGIAHGRLKEKEIIKVMSDFQNKKLDILLATTIIESGLDFPNVNTLIVAETTKLGLAQAYQIRGRIGRSSLQAFAYFLYQPCLSEKAKRRLQALKEAESLGSGYRIALKDLEIRGAGNILGKEQSGNINQIGLNLYCQMISEAIEKIKNVQNKNRR